MKTALAKIGCAMLFAVGAALFAGSGQEDHKVWLRLVDADSGKSLGGMVRVFPVDGGKALPLPGLFDRLRGLERSETVAGWHVVPAGGAETHLPRKSLRVEGLSGLETTLPRREFDLSSSAPDEIAIPLKFVFQPAQRGLAAGNTHLHLRNLSMEQSDEYLRQIPPADGLQVLFISYLERHKDDAGYITNRYPAGELKQFAATGVLYSNGEEHRHNFDAYGQGYGHVMFLGIQSLVKPASLGPGLTGAGFDDRPLRVGIDEARGQGATIIWCHNTNGHEDLPNALAGRLDALNVFDGSRTGKYEDNYYRYLNIGLRLPISTGTDWFMYDFSRVYAKTKTPLTLRGWLEAVKAGRSVATNGPLLTLRVDGQEIGGTLSLQQPRTVRVEASGVGRHDFQQLQIIHNGKVVATQPTRKSADYFQADLTRELRIDAPGWLAMRIESTTKNELGHVLYAHTSPVYLDLGGRRIFDLDSAQALLKQLDEGRADIRSRGRFSNPEAAAKLLAEYDAAARDLKARMSRRGK